jgi:hypothetical protein
VSEIPEEVTDLATTDNLKLSPNEQLVMDVLKDYEFEETYIDAF